jgi:copper(I)-binding protein
MKRLVPIVAALLLAGCAPGNPRASVTNAVVTLPAVPGRPGAAYFTLLSNRPARLTAITSPQVGRIELHETMSMNGMSRMEPLHEVAIAAGTPLIFQPGGRHAMLYDVAPTLRRGQRVALTFTIEPFPPVTVEAEVRGPGEGFSPR